MFIRKNILVVGSLISGATIFTPAHADEATKAMSATILKEGAQIAASGDIPAGVKSAALQATGRTVEDQAKELISPYFNYVEASVGAGDSLAGSTYELIAIKAYDNKGADNGFVFNQFGLNYYDNRKTVNLGLGYRHMLDDKRWMLGVNAFYDHEFPNNHQRMGAGVEVKSSAFKAAYNHYEGLSDYKKDRSGTDSKALGGYDVRLDLTLPYLPGANLGYQKFKWKGEGTAADLGGTKLSLAGKLSRYLQVDAGRTYYDNNARNDDNWVKLTFQMNFGPSGNEPTLFDVSENAYQLAAIDYERYKPVKRENKIVKQKKFAATVTGN